MKKTLLFLLFSNSVLLCKANSQHYTCENCNFFHDSLYNYAIDVSNAWIERDSVKILEFQSRFLNSNLPKSQFYFFSNTLEYLSGLSFGAYEDAEEYAPSLDNDSNKNEMLRRKIISEFYIRIFNENYVFCHYPSQFKYFFDTLLHVSFEKNELDTVLFNKLIVNLNDKIEKNSISLIGNRYQYRLGDTAKREYLKELKEKFNLKDIDYFSEIQFILEDGNTDDTTFFGLANALFNVVNLKFYPDSIIQITDYGFVNERKYKDLKKYIVFFFNSYFNSNLCFTEIPLEKREYVYKNLYKTDYSNINSSQELTSLLNDLYVLIKNQ